MSAKANMSPSTWSMQANEITEEINILLTAWLGLLSVLRAQGPQLTPTSAQEVRGSERVGWGDEAGPGQEPALG